MAASDVPQRIYHFGGGTADGDHTLKALLGGKGANLGAMARLGLPVPPGFTIATPLCLQYHAEGALAPGLMDDVRVSIGRIEELTGKTFGAGPDPLLVSVRSGAAISMPGMMDTVLNLGMNPAVSAALGALAGDRFAKDAERRFIQMFGNVVDGIEGRRFEEVLETVKHERGASEDTDLDAAGLDDVVTRYRTVYRAATGRDFPDAPWEQLERAVEAVFASWENPRARTYRRLNRIGDDLGTAVTVQAMVFGNLGDDCGTGVGFTRDPSTGAKLFYGEYLANAQGEDVVAGIRTPLPIRAARAGAMKLAGRSLEELHPHIHAELMRVAATLEAHYGDVQDLEFTFERDTLYLLQTRTAKRTGQAWLMTQVALVDEGVIEPNTALARIPADSLAQVLAPSLDASAASSPPLARGLNAGPGAATGMIAFTADDAERRAQLGQAVILVRDDTTPEDIHGMHAARGILTARGGLTSHAAVVARGMGKPCIVGCGALHINAHEERLTIEGAGVTLGPGDTITIDGSTGAMMLGEQAIATSEVLQVLVDRTLAPRESPTSQAFARVMEWADAARTMGVRTNADTPADAAVARSLGAEGIGLCRTEHMFFDADRIFAMRRMILAETEDERKAALAAIEPMQVNDFKGLFRVMRGMTVTIRTLDPPLHEFLPHDESDIAELARHTRRSVDAVRARVHALRESNPMLGHRGCRLGLHFPEITRMQARAIIRAALDVALEGVDVHPEIMIPLVGNRRELDLQKREVSGEIEALFKAAGRRVPVQIGTMIEIPRAALTAAEIAEHADFFSFGTNDLTQMTLGVSRDDSGAFLPDYVAKGIYKVDPFVSIDQTGVGRLMRIAVEEGRGRRPELKVGICGEHGGDPESVRFCYGLGLDYVSCSPYRVPVARLAAAQAALED